MFESQRENFEYHLNIFSVKMKVKFPCRMKVEHLGSLITGESPPSDDNRFIFNQEVILKDDTQADCFELTVNLLTDKGAKYIAGVIKLYKSELVRSEGERLVLSLSKCIDSEAFCEVKVDQVIGTKPNRNAPFDKKSVLQRQVTYRRENQQFDLSPYRNNPVKILQSKSEYQFPLHNNGHKRVDWETKSKSRLQPPQTIHQKPKMTQRINYAVQQSTPYNQFQLGDSNIVGRQKALEAEVYKQGYQKLKEKYKKQAQNSKQQLNKRLALQNAQNNLKLQIMRIKLKMDQQDKSLSDKNNKLKQLQTKISLLQEKEMEYAYLRQDMNKKENLIRSQQQKIRNLTRNIEELKDMTADRTLEENNRVRQLQSEIQSLRNKYQSKQKEYERQIKGKNQAIHFKDIQLMSAKDILQRQKKNNADLEKSLQAKHNQLQRLIHHEKNNTRTKIDQYKSKAEKLQYSLNQKQQQLKNQAFSSEQYKGHIVKLQYDNKLISQEIQSLRLEYNEYKVYKQKYSQAVRENKSLIQKNNQLQHQLERAIQNKQYNITEINKQYQEQVQYYKRINRQLDEKNKSISNKLIENEGQLELSRNQQDKLRRSLQSTLKQAAQAKQKEKSAKKALKVKEQQALSLETQHAALKQKLKSIEQIYKLQVDKAKDEVDKLQVQLQNEQERVEQLAQTNNTLTMQLNRIKIKLQYSEQKSQKDASNLKQKQQHIEGLIKDYEQQVSALDRQINNLRFTEKEQSNKIQQKEIELIKNEEKYQKAKKDMRVFEQKYSQLENSLKNKINQNDNICADRDSIAKRLAQSESDCNAVKGEVNILTTQKAKLTKILESAQQQSKKLKNELSNANSTIAERQRQYEQLSNDLKQQKQEYSKLDIKSSAFKKEVQRYKESLNDTVHRYIVPLYLKDDSKKSFEQMFINKSSEHHFNDIINLIVAQSKEVKQVISKQSEQLKQLQRQSERAHEQASQSTSKYQTVQSTLRRQIEQLQAEYSQYHQQKELQCANYSHIIGELDQRVKGLQATEQELNTQIQQLNFTINSLKMDFQAINDQQTKKIINFKKLTAQQQQKIEYQLLTITELDERCTILENEIDNLQNAVEHQSQNSHKKDKAIEQLKEINQNQEKVIQQLKRHKKQLLQKVSELQLHLNTERQFKQKNKSLLEEQQFKGNELKTFISNLMKQKQAAIKSELERSQKLIEFQGAYLELSKEAQLLKEQNERIARALQQQKQQNKKQVIAIKELQGEQKEQRSKCIKIQDRLKEKEKELLNKEQTYKKNEQKYEKALERFKHQLQQLQQELQVRNNHSLQSNKDTNSKIISLQAQIQDKNSQIAILLAKAIQHQEEIYAQRQKNMHNNQQIVKVKSQYQQAKSKLTQVTTNLSQVTNQSKQKQQKLFELSGNVFTLQAKLQSKQKQLSKRIDEINQQWLSKYESMCQQYEQRMQLIEKQRDYFRNQSQEKDKDLSKLAHALKNAESSEAAQRRQSEDKIRKLQEEKLSLFTVKNNQIQRLVEQAKIFAQTSKQRQNELRRLTNQLQVARKTITNLDNKSKDYDQKIKGINKVYQTQLEQLKKKDVNHKAYREAVNNYHWSIEREIKKNIQNFIKTFLQISEDKNSTKLVQLVRNLQRATLQTIAQKPVQK